MNLRFESVLRQIGMECSHSMNENFHAILDVVKMWKRQRDGDERPPCAGLP